MSFSNDVKNEIARLELGEKDECLSEITALFRVNGTLNYSAGNFSLRFLTENNPIARRIYSIFKKLYSYEAGIQISNNNQLRRKSNYRIIIDNPNIVENFLTDAGFEVSQFALYDENIKKELINTDAKRRAYIRGSFLGAGSVINPERHYHLEIVTSSDGYSKNIIKLLKSFNISSNKIERKNNSIIYLKDSEMISDFLSLVGAYQALLKLENIRALRDLKNNVNRVINCETANMDKTIDAGLKQVKVIKKIDEKIGIENLPENLKVVANLRLQHPAYSLKQIGESVNPPIGKSGVNHRLKKLLDIAKEL